MYPTREEALALLAGRNIYDIVEKGQLPSFHIRQKPRFRVAFAVFLIGPTCRRGR